MKLRFISIKYLIYSGQGENAIHLKVINEFEKSYKDGEKFCLENEYNLLLENNYLTISSEKVFGFKFIAKVEKID